MVDPEKVTDRLERLAELLDELSEIEKDGYDSYRTSFRSRLDIGAHLIAEEGLKMPNDYRGVFASLKEGGLESELADRLSAAAGMRNILVHDYLTVDDEAVWGALGRLGDLHQFSGFVKSKIT